MTNDLLFFRVELETMESVPTLSSVEFSEIYIGVECQDGRCDNQKLIHPKVLSVPLDDFNSLEVPELAKKMKCTRCGALSPRISYFKECDPLNTSVLVGEEDLFSLTLLDTDGSLGKRYNHEISAMGRWARSDINDYDPYDLGSAPDPAWSEDEQLAGSDPGHREVDQLVSEHDQLSELEAANKNWHENEQDK